MVAHGAPYSRDQSERRDVVEIEGAVRLRQRQFWLAGRPMVHKRLGSLAGSSDVLVVDQSLRNLELYPLLLRGSAGRGPRIAMWDHGRTYTHPQSRLEQSLKYALTRRVCWFFAYTDGGARAVAEHGFPRHRVTVVQNAIDTVELRRALDALTERELDEFRAERARPGTHRALPRGVEPEQAPAVPGRGGCGDRRTTAGLQAPDRGHGEQRGLVDRAAGRTRAIVPVGQLFGARKALLGAAADVMLMPGLVGLCAVDSFALATPIVTTAWPWHAPEFEYLEHGRNALVAPDEPRRYASTVVELLEDPARLGALRQACRDDARRYTVEEMSRRFADGLVKLLQETGR